LQQFDDYQFHPAQFEVEPKVILFDRAAAFLVRPPRIDAKPTRFVRRDKTVEAWNDEDRPF
jgi:hypothetical protein